MTQVSFKINSSDEKQGWRCIERTFNWKLIGLFGTICLVTGLVLLVVNIDRKYTSVFIASALLLLIALALIIMSCCFYDEFRSDSNVEFGVDKFQNQSESRQSLDTNQNESHHLYVRESQSLPVSAAVSPLSLSFPVITGSFLSIPEVKESYNMLPNVRPDDRLSVVSTISTSSLHKNSLPIVSM